MNFQMRCLGNWFHPCLAILPIHLWIALWHAPTKFYKGLIVSVNSEEILVEVAYALPDQQVILPVKLSAGTNAEAAIQQSGILAKFPEISLAENKIGIFGKLTQLDAPLRDKDRVEIYRPLIADPKEVRRQRAEAGKVMKKGGGDIAE